MEINPGRDLELRGLIRSVYAPSLLHATGYGMLSPAVPLFASDLDVALVLIGLLASLQWVGATLADVPAGLLVARVGGRTAMSLGIGASALGALVLGASQTTLQLFIAVPLIGVGLALWATARLAYVADVAPSHQRGRALALAGGASRIGMTVGPIAGGFLTQALGLQAAFFGHALMALLALALMSTVRRNAVPPHIRDPHDGERAHVRVLRTVAEHRRAFASAGSAAVSLVMVRSARSVLMPLWGAWLGLDLAEIGLVIGLASALDMTLFYPVGVVMDRYGRKWTIVPSLVLLSASLTLVPFTFDFASFLVAGLVGGLGNGLGTGAIMTMGADLAPPVRRGEFLGVWRLISDSGGVIAPALVGGLAQTLTLGAAFFAMGGIGAGGALLMALVVDEGLRRRSQTAR